MKYPSNTKLQGELGYNGFELTHGKVYLKYRLSIASSILGKAVNLSLKAYHFVVESGKSASTAMHDIRLLNNRACAYIDYEQDNGAHELFIFCRESINDVEQVLNQHYQEFELCGEYDIKDHQELVQLVRLCHECCIDNDCDGSGKRYFNKSQLTDVEKKREIYMLPSVLDRNAA